MQRIGKIKVATTLTRRAADRKWAAVARAEIELLAPGGAVLGYVRETGSGSGSAPEPAGKRALDKACHRALQKARRKYSPPKRGSGLKRTGFESDN